MSVHALKDELRRKRLQRRPVTGLRLRRPIYLVRHADKHASPVMGTFLAIVRAALADERKRARSG
jgi:DNA-binding transcriptional LysR family regulator